MPKTLRNIWSHVTAFENLHRAWKRASRGKRYVPEVLRFGERLEENLCDIQGRLLHKTWLPSPWREFVCREPKLRLIQAPAFADRVVHHALVSIINPAFERRFIPDSLACRERRGTHAASQRLTCFMRSASHAWGKPYVIKADISRYFPNIDHDILMQILCRTVGDKNALWLIERIVRESGFVGTGMPIGSLTSQLFANAYLDMLDHYVKDMLGVRYYVRYMDDFVIIGQEKAKLHDLLEDIADYLYCTLKLRLNPKTDIFPLSHGIDFAGYRHWTNKKLPRKRNVKNMRVKLRRMSELYSRGIVGLEHVKARIMSFIGYMRHCNGHRTCGSVLGDVVLCRRESVQCLP